MRSAMTGKTALLNARLLDPATVLDHRGGVLIENGVIADLGPQTKAGSVGDADTIDCGGHVLAPGLIDMMVSTGEPGHEHRETSATASQAAGAGGATRTERLRRRRARRRPPAASPPSSARPTPIPSSTTWLWSISCSAAPAI